MKVLFLLMFGSLVNVSWCQNSVLTKHQMAKIFVSDDDHKEWIICNQDSSFFKSDTLRLYSTINYFYQKSNCCKLIKWDFYKKNAFTRSSLQVCTEPPTGSVLTENDYFKIKLPSDKSSLYLVVVNRTHQNFFKVIDVREERLANNQKSKVIVLKRLMGKDSAVEQLY